MFRLKRLAREDYLMMWKNRIWNLSDATALMASFEMELSGIFGESKEFFKFSLQFDDSSENADPFSKEYNKMWSKWDDLISGAMFRGDILYENLPDRYIDPPDEYSPDGCTLGKRIDSGNNAFTRKEFIQWLLRDVKAGKVKCNLEALQEFFSGNGPAPVRSIVKEVEIPPAEYFRKLANKSHAPRKSKKQALRDFLRDDLGGGCTCTKRQAVERIFNEKYRGDEAYLKKEAGITLLTFKRAVSEVLMDIEAAEKTGYNRHDNTKGFSDHKPPECEKHSS